MFDFKVKTYHEESGVRTTAELQGADHNQSYLVDFDTCSRKGEDELCFITQMLFNPNTESLICAMYPCYDELQRLNSQSPKVVIK